MSTMTDYGKLIDQEGSADVVAQPSPDVHMQIPSDLPEVVEPSQLYGSLMDADGEQAKARLNVVLDTAFKHQPDTAASDKSLAATMGLPVEVVERNRDEVQRIAKIRQVQSMTSASPVLARQLSDPEFAKLAHDSVESLSAIESALRFAKNSGGAMVGGLYGASAGVVGVAQSGFDVASPFLEPLVGRVIPGNPLKATAHGLNAYRQQIEATSKGWMPQGGGNIESGWYSGLASLSRNLAGLPLAFAPGGQSAALTAMTAPVFGQEFGTARDRGLPVANALTYGASQAAIEYATEKMPLSRLIGDVKAGETFLKTIGRQALLEVPNEQVATILQDLNEWAVLNPDKPFADYLAERPDAAVQTLVATLVGVGGQTSVVKGVDYALNAASRQEQKAQSGAEGAQLLEQLNKLAAADKLLARDPETFERFVEQAAAESEVSHVYVDAEVLNQDGMGMKLAEVSPSVAAQLQTAIETGGSVAIPVQEYASKIAPTEHATGLLDHLRTEEDGMSRAEAKAFMETAQQQFQESLAIQEQQLGADRAFQASAEVVRQTVREQLEAVSRFTPQVNDAYTSMVGNFYAVQAARMGMTPEEMYKLYPLKVTGTPVSMEDGFNQGEQSDAPAESESSDRLIVAHNLSAANLVHASELGGLPAPSLAVTKADSPLTGYGEITLIGGSDMAKPSAKNPVFDADVYSPRFPSVQVKVNERLVNQVLDPIRNAAQAMGARMRDVWYTLEDMQRGKLGEAVTALSYDAGTRLAFANTVLGKSLAVPMKQEAVAAPVGGLMSDARFAMKVLSMKDGLDDLQPGTDESRSLAKALNAAQMRAVSKMLGDQIATDEGFKKYVGAVSRRLSMYGSDTSKDSDGIDVLNDLSRGGIERIKMLAKNSGEPGASAQTREVVDTDALMALADKEVPREVFEGWLREQLAPAMGERRIVKENGKTAAYTMDNIVREMTRKVRDAEGFNYGLGNARSKLATKFKKLSEIQSQRNRVVSGAHFEAARKEIEAEFNSLIELVDGLKTYERDSTSELLAEAIGDAFSKGVPKALEDASFKGVPEDVQKRIGEFAAALAGAPTEYFEIKAQRAVDLGEFAGAVVPEGAPAEVVELLEAKGLQILKYGPEEGGRAKAVRNLAHTLHDTSGNVLFQDNGPVRGTFAPSSLTISLLANADLSTFLHESGHFFLEVQLDMAQRLEGEAALFGSASLKDSEREVIADAHKLLEWFGVPDMQSWFNMTLEEKRQYHEQFARGFEAYLAEGNAPSVEMQGIFQRFRAWMIAVYKDLKRLNVELTADVRAVMDRMIASTEEIKVAEMGRSMAPLFATADMAGMTPEAFAEYQKEGVAATQAAIDELQAKGMRDMQWLQNYRLKALKKLNQEAKAQRAELEIEARKEVMSQQVYQVWQFLTGKLDAESRIAPAPKASSTEGVNPEQDSLFVAIAKLGGLNRAEVASQWGWDEKERSPQPAFGKPLLRRGEGGLSIDAMAERLKEYGYLVENDDPRQFEEVFQQEYRGQPHYSVQRDYSNSADYQTGDQILNPDAVPAGRLDVDELRLMGFEPTMIELLKARKMTAKDAWHPLMVAERFGYDSAEAMVADLVQAAPPKEAIAQLADQMMLERHGELASPDAISRAADQAVHNEVRARMIATELKAITKAAGSAREMAAAAKAFAAQMIARQRIMDLKPLEYARAETRAAKAAAKALAAGDTQKSAIEKRNQLLNAQAARQGYDTQDEVKRAVRYLRGLLNGKGKIDQGYRDQIAAMLERFSLAQASNVAIGRRQSLANWIEQQRELGIEPDLAPELMDEAFRQNWREMTVEQFRGLVEAVQQLEHLGRLKHKLLAIKDKREFEVVRDSVVASIREHFSGKMPEQYSPATNAEARKLRFNQYFVNHLKVSNIAQAMDGGETGGEMWGYFVRSAQERANWKSTKQAQLTEQLMEIMIPVMKRNREMRKREFYPALGMSMTREQVFAIALNLGNEGNISRLLTGGLNGRKVSMQDLVGIVESRLTAEDLQAVQAIWDLMGTLAPEAQAKNKRVYGVEMAMVEPTPLVTKFGTLRGGYYPIVYDPRGTVRSADISEEQAAKEALQAARTAATTRRTYTKTRSAQTPYPLMLSFDGVHRGLSQVVHDLAWHEWSIDTGRMLRDVEFQQAVRETYGKDYLDTIKRWHDDIVQENTREQDAFSRFSLIMRSNISVSAMGYSLLTAIQQPIGMTQSAAKYGSKRMAKALASFVGSPKAKTKEVFGLSEFMRNRSRSRYREVSEMKSQIDLSGNKLAEANRYVVQHAFDLMGWVQLSVDVPTWMAGYEQALEQGHPEDKAIAMADQGVIDSQGDGAVQNLSAMQRSQLGKIFTLFYTYLSSALNMIYQTSKSERSLARKTHDVMMLTLIPATLTAFLKWAIMPADDDDGEEKYWRLVKEIIKENVALPLSMFVGVRELAGVADLAVGETPFSYSGPSGVRIVGDTLRMASQTTKAIMEGEATDATRKAAVTFVGSATGLPAAQINRTITGAKALAEGDTTNPAALGFGFKKQ